MTHYQNLKVWKKSMALVKMVYQICSDFPRGEVYALTSQIKKSAVSIPSNIAEGIGRNYKKDTLQFLHISRGSLYELETQPLIAYSLNYINAESKNIIIERIQECLKILNGFIQYFEKPDLK